MGICFANSSIKFCIDHRRENEGMAGSSRKVELPAIFMMSFTGLNQKEKRLRIIFTIIPKRRAFLPYFSRWWLLLIAKNRLKVFIFNLLSIKLASQNRVFVENRPFTREFKKDLPFGWWERCVPPSMLIFLGWTFRMEWRFGMHLRYVFRFLAIVKMTRWETPFLDSLRSTCVRRSNC